MRRFLVSARETSRASGTSLRRGRWIAGAKAKARRREGKSPAFVAAAAFEMRFFPPSVIAVFNGADSSLV